MRVVLLPKEAGGAPAGDGQITIDVLAGADGTVVGPFPAFGRVGDFKKPDTLYPFTLMGDGRMDFGAHAAEPERHDKLAIRSMPLIPGGEILRLGQDRSEAFVIDTVTPLAAA